MNFFTARNLVILALIQVGAITAGVLAAGAYVKWMSELHLQGPRGELEFICDFGWIALALPIAWAAVALWEFRRETEDDSRKVVVVILGWLLLALLIYGSWHYSVGPWLRLMTGCGGLSD
jgi:TRAP-type C4-dicarboxylate transport system permease small subunit